MKKLIKIISKLGKKFNKRKPTLKLDKEPQTNSQKVILETFNTMLECIVEPINLSSLKGKLLRETDVQASFIGKLEHETLILKGLNQTLEASSIFRKTNSIHLMSNKVSQDDTTYTLNTEDLHYLSPSAKGPQTAYKPLIDKENFSLPLLPISVSLPCGSLERPGDLEYFGQSAGYILATYENFVFTKLLMEVSNLTEHYGDDLADIYLAIKRGGFKNDILVILPKSFLEDSEDLSRELNHAGKVKYLFVPDCTLKGLNVTSIVLEKSDNFNVHGFQGGPVNSAILEVDEDTVVVQVQAFIGYSMSGQTNACIVKYNYNLEEMKYEFL